MSGEHGRHSYRIVSETSPKQILEYADTIQQALSIAETVDGLIECYQWGIGWIKWHDKWELGQ